MRVISGKCRGTKLFSLEGNNTRPTLDRVKESLFNIINFEIQDCVFLDLFAGSGAIGIEAASRGAKKVYMCENNKDACDVINKNITKTKLENQITLYNMDFQKCIMDKLNETFDIIYLDPPYKTDFALIATKLLLEKKLITDKTIIILETDSEQTVENQFEKLSLKEFNKKKYGRASLLFYKAK
ncbi:MAG: 16S rRNA (guanine(966)-N(2))-methyltransferase RsmD [Clostridia bacterium]|nr:16S rRNA (guanine(966)-N(2))-methyltransferase RsmD [Clostridia bacterium]